MNTMMNLNENELAAVVGGNDIPEFDVKDDVLPAEFTNISIDGIDLYIHCQFQLPECTEPARAKKTNRPRFQIDGRA